MNLCATCQWVDERIADGRYMVGGTSLCRRHMVIEMENRKNRLSSDASKPTVKWEDDTVAS